MGADGRAGGAAGACVMDEADGMDEVRGMEASAFVREVADGCWAAGIRDPGRSAKANPHNPHKYHAS
jgi:hypothetical protein